MTLVKGRRIEAENVLLVSPYGPGAMCAEQRHNKFSKNQLLARIRNQTVSRVWIAFPEQAPPRSPSRVDGQNRCGELDWLVARSPPEYLCNSLAETFYQIKGQRNFRGEPTGPVGVGPWCRF